MNNNPMNNVIKENEENLITKYKQNKQKQLWIRRNMYVKCAIGFMTPK